jgi:hypothetical protein
MREDLKLKMDFESFDGQKNRVSKTLWRLVIGVVVVLWAVVLWTLVTLWFAPNTHGGTSVIAPKVEEEVMVVPPGEVVTVAPVSNACYDDLIDCVLALTKACRDSGHGAANHARLTTCDDAGSVVRCCKGACADATYVQCSALPPPGTPTRPKPPGPDDAIAVPVR